MKRFMMAVLIMLVAAFATVPAFAGPGLSSDAVGSAGFGKLSEAEKAEVLKMVAEKAAQKEAQTPGTLEKVVEKVTPTADGVDKWMTVGEKFGKMMGGAAKEVGIAVNDFVKTPVGMMTAGLIVWHYTGGVMIHLFGGIMIIVVGFAYLRYMINRTVPLNVTYDQERKNIFGNLIIVAKKREKMDDEALGWYTFCGGLIIVASMIAIFTY